MLIPFYADAVNYLARAMRRCYRLYKHLAGGPHTSSRVKVYKVPGLCIFVSPAK